MCEWSVLSHSLPNLFFWGYLGKTRFHEYASLFFAFLVLKNSRCLSKEKESTQSYWNKSFSKQIPNLFTEKITCSLVAPTCCTCRLKETLSNTEVDCMGLYHIAFLLPKNEAVRKQWLKFIFTTTLQQYSSTVSSVLIILLMTATETVPYNARFADQKQTSVPKTIDIQGIFSDLDKIFVRTSFFFLQICKCD